MIFKSFLLVNLVSVCMKISNSVVLVGLYYGFISAFSMGSSYLFLLRPRFLEEDQDAIEKKVSETSGFFTGQLLIFISILYVPLHLALGRPQTLLLLVPPYFFFHFLCNNSGEYPERLFSLEFTNSLRNLRIQWVFLNNVLLQLFSLSLLARPMLTRLSHIYIFQCNNKMLFVLSSFVGWLIGHLLVVKWVGLVFVWILKLIRSKRMKYITSNVLIPSIKCIRENWRNSFVAGLIREILGMKRVESILVSIKNSKELDDTLWWIGSSLLVNDIKLLIRFYVKLVLHGFQNVYMRLKFIEDMEHLFTIVLFAIFLFYLDRTPFFLRDPRDKISKMHERLKRELQEVKEREDIEEELQEKQEGFLEEHIYPSLLSEERGDPKEIDKREENSKLAILKEEKYFFSFVKPLSTPLFDPKKSLRPLRYIKTCAGVEKAVKNETSQYFFYTCRSDGKERICFTYPPSLSTFWEMIQRKIFSAFPRIYDEGRALGWYDPGSYIQWTYSNEQKKNSLSTEFQNRIKTLDKKRSLLNVFQKRKRLCNDTTKKVYLPEICDPFLTGAQRAKIENFFSSSILNNNQTLIQNDVELSSLKKKNKISPRMIRSSINKLHVLLIPKADYDKLKKKIDIVNTSVIPIKKTKFSLFLFKSKKVKIDVEGAKKFCKSLLNPILPDPKRNRQTAIGLQEITKKVPRWSYKLIDELEQAEGTAEGERMFSDHDLRLLPFKRLAVFNEKSGKTGPLEDEYGNPVRRKRLYSVRFLGEISDYRRGLIKGSPRHDRRKAYVCSLYQVNPRSPIFAFRRRSIFSFFGNIAVQAKFFFEAHIIKKAEKNWLATFLDNREEQRKILGLSTTSPKEKIDEDLEDEIRIENVMEMWENIDFGQAVRALILLMHIFLRKKIVFPSFIIGKNIARILLLQAPEWSIDFARLKRERYAICTYYGLAVSHKLGYEHLPLNWTLDGLQIQVINPFSLKPWDRVAPRSSQKDKDPNKIEYREIRFLTSFGLLTDRPFGDPITPDWEAFFNPIGKALKKKIIKLEKKQSRILSKRLENVLKKTKQWVIKSILFLNRELSKRHPIALFVVRESSELTLSQKDIDNLKNKQDLRMSNQRISEALLQGPVRALKDDSLSEEKGADSEKELTDLDNQLREIWDHIDKVTKERKKRVLTPEPDSPDKLVQEKKTNLKKFKRIKARLIRQKYYFLRIRKSYYVLLFFIKRISSNIKRIYLNLIRCAISIRKIHPQLFFENSKKISEKSIPNKEKVYKTNIYKPKTKKKKNLFISIFKESLSDNDIRISEYDIKLTNIWASNKTKKSKGHSDLSSVSQAYVFYKLYLYQTQPINLDKLRYVLQYHGTSLFLKKEIKDYFEAQEIFHSKLKHKNLLNSGKNQWKNWLLKAHSQYSVFPILLNSLSHQKWRTKVNQQRMDENTDLEKRYSNEKRKQFFEENSLDNEENLFGFGTYRGKKDGAIKNSIKYSSYERFSYQSINSEDKYVSPLCINNKQKISYNRRKGNLFDRPEGIALINNFLVQNDLLDLYTFPDRKYFHWRLLPAGLIGFKQKAATAKNWTSANSGDTVKYWTAANGNTSIKPGVFLNWQNDERTKNQSPLFDWLGMNTEIKNNCISDLKGWFFPELIQADLRYQLKPRIIPIELLFVNKERDENLIQDPIEEEREKFIQNENAIQNLIENFLANKNIKRNTKLEDPYKTRKAIDLALEKKKEKKGPGDLKPYTPDKLKRPFGEYLKNGDIRSSQVRSPGGADETDYDRLDILKVNGYELNKLKPIKNKKGVKRTLLTSIKRGRLKMEFSKTHKSLKDIVVTTGLFAIEPLRISRQNKDEEFLIYQMIKIPLGQKIDPYDSDLFVPETILSTKRRRELRILISFYSRNGNLIHKNPVFCKYVKKCGEVVDNSEKKKKKLIKSFLWPNYRLEDLACMNRYWFNTNNGSRLSMLRIHMYPRLKIL